MRSISRQEEVPRERTNIVLYADFLIAHSGFAARISCSKPSRRIDVAMRRW
jgi:hypothetical protein